MLGNVRFFNCDPFPNKQSLHQTDFVLGFRLIKSDFVTSLLLDDPATVPELTLEEVDGLSLSLQRLFELAEESKKGCRN